MKKINKKEVKLLYVVGYVRTATKKQRLAGATEMQMGAIGKYAKDNGYTIKEMYIDEGFSGNIPKRPALQRMREDAKKKQFSHVVIYDCARLSRNYLLYKKLEAELKRSGIKIVSVTDINDQMTERIRGVFADYERKAHSARIKLGIASRNIKNQIKKKIL